MVKLCLLFKKELLSTIRRNIATEIFQTLSKMPIILRLATEANNHNLH